MAEDNSLLGFIAQRHTSDLEDVATNALSFILSRWTAKRALADFLGDERGPLHIAKAQPWRPNEHGAVPDLACLDGDCNLVALIESKFWAELTAHQPVTYWEGLPNDRPTVLLFLVPDSRVDVDKVSLWCDLVDRLRNCGHELGPAVRDESRITAPAKVGQRRLMLTSWELLLDWMAQRAKKDGDTQACFEIAELRGLADSAIAGDKPTRDKNLKRLIADAVKRVEQSGWATTAGLTEGGGRDYYARYLSLAGASAGLRIDYKAKKRMDKPLWAWFYRESATGVSVEAVRSSLGSLAEDLDWLSGDVCVPIVLPAGADREATLDAIVAKLERVAKLIDPNGPTYREAQ